MQNPFQSSGEDNAGLNDPLSFVRKLWGDMQLPGMVTPTLSVDELDKQIRDLKTVEAWLNLNLNMLSTSIQALEVQRATITALKAMGESFSNHAARGGSTNSQDADPSGAWPMHKKKVSEAEADAENMNATDSDEPNEADEQEHEEAPAQTHTASANAAASDKAQAQPNSPDASEQNFVNPAAWWNVLQEQFKHALGQALKEDDESTSERPARKKAANTGAAKKKVPTRSKTGASSTSKGTTGSKATATQSRSPVKARTAVRSSKPKSSTSVSSKRAKSV